MYQEVIGNHGLGVKWIRQSPVPPHPSRSNWGLKDHFHVFLQYISNCFVDWNKIL